jgi:hypothetical protein
MALKDPVRLTMILQDPRLLELIDELNLTTLFGAQLV